MKYAHGVRHMMKEDSAWWNEEIRELIQKEEEAY